MSYKLRVDEKTVFEKHRFINAQGNAECVEFIRQTTGAPHTSVWVPGLKLSEARPGEIARGTVIATFDSNKRYPKDALGKHAAIYLEHNDVRMVVLDQWKALDRVQKREIKFKQGKGVRRSNNADTFWVIE